MNTCGSTFLKRSLLSSAANTATFRASRPLRHRIFHLDHRAYMSTMSSQKVQNINTVSNGTKQAQMSTASSAPVQGDLNNTSSMRQIEEIDPEFAYRSLAIPTGENDPDTLAKYRPFLLDDAVASQDWVAKLELATVTEMAHNDITKTGERLKVLVLYGSLRNR
jgi:hypothetical protein